MSYEVVAHPETGEPAVVERSYRVLELESERAKLAELEAQLPAKQAEVDRVSDELTALESAVEDQKSLLERATEVAQPSGVEAGAEGASGETEAEATSLTF